MKLDIMHIGVDVCKVRLDIYVPAAKEGASPMTLEVDNDIKGFRQLRDLARRFKAVVCVEPTGGYELELIAFLHKFDVAVAYADALRVRHFARAEGGLSKNDTIDAALISRFADKIGVRPIEKWDVDLVELRRKVKLRQTLMDSCHVMTCRLETETDPAIKSMLRTQIRHLNKLIGKIEESCTESVAKNERVSGLQERFVKVGGVSNITAVAILAGKIGSLPNSKLNRLAGISPEQKQSGTHESQRKIWGGRKDVRNALYMSTLASIQQETRRGTSAQVGDGASHAQDVVAPQQDRARSRLRADTGARIDEEERSRGQETQGLLKQKRRSPGGVLPAPKGHRQEFEIDNECRIFRAPRKIVCSLSIVPSEAR